MSYQEPNLKNKENVQNQDFYEFYNRFNIYKLGMGHDYRIFEYSI